DNAFEALVREQTGAMLAVARRFLPNDEDARDAVQEAFLSVHRALEAFEGGSRLSTWVHRIVVNACLMKLRAPRSRPEALLDDLLPRFLDDGDHAEPPAPWDSRADAGAMREETRAIVRGAIDELPEIYRTVLLLRDIEGVGNEEASKLLGVT